MRRRFRLRNPGRRIGPDRYRQPRGSGGAFPAYRQSLALDDRVLSLDPNLLRVKRGIAISQMKIGSVEMDTDPAQALKDLEAALDRAEALAKTEVGGLPADRLREMLLRKEGNALVRLGECARAVALFDQALEISRRPAVQDPKDFRALYDVVTVLEDEAIDFEDAANPLLAPKGGDRRVNLIHAEKNLVEAAADLERLLKQDPTNDVWKADRGNAQVRIGVIRAALQTPGGSGEVTRKGLAALREVAEKPQAAPLVLDQAANAFLTAEPASLRDPGFAVSCAEREVAVSHRKMPFRLLTLAQAYRAAGQMEKSRAAAKEGLALLPAVPSGSAKPNVRKLLEFEVQTGP